MREILFRGKRVDNGEWVYGNLIGDSTIIPRNQDFEVEADCIYGCDLTAYIVDPATVGQYTGLTDKNGKKIWEGDKFDKYNSIEYCNGCFCVNGDVPLSYWAESREVIGNVYDNPELLQN